MMQFYQQQSPFLIHPLSPTNWIMRRRSSQHRLASLWPYPLHNQRGKFLPNTHTHVTQKQGHKKQVETFYNCQTHFARRTLPDALCQTPIYWINFKKKCYSNGYMFSNSNISSLWIIFILHLKFYICMNIRKSRNIL